MANVETDRIVLRQWRESDIQAFISMNCDPMVMKFFPVTYSPEKTRSLVVRVRQQISQNGWGFWAAERKDSNEFIGFIGINPVKEGLPFAPCVDIGWRLAVKHWGQGFATEGARAALEFGFMRANLQEIVSMTPVTNNASERVMQKLGMTKQTKNFDHPAIADGHPLREHVLYKMSREEWSNHA